MIVVSNTSPLTSLAAIGRMLIEAKASGLIDRLKPELVALRQRAGFYLSDAVIQEGLRLAGEDDRTPADS